MPGSNDQSVLRESLFIKDIEAMNLNITRVPKYIAHGTVKGARFLAMDFLENSIKDELAKSKQNPEKWRASVCNMAVQMLEAVEEFHRTGKVHRDIKPDNFRVHQGKVCIIDFGNIFDFERDGEHVAMTSGYAFKGTLWFASVMSHKRISHSRRDDLEGLGYSILHYMTNGEMPWEKIESTEIQVSTSK